MTDIEDLDVIVSSGAYPEILSISRRTDVPAFYMDEYLKCLIQGYIDVPNPMMKSKVYRVYTSPDTVKAIVWWSKDYGKFILRYLENPDFFKKYRGHFFHFTINSRSELEPGLQSTLEERLCQLSFLVQTFGADHVTLRIDPITIYRVKATGEVRDNLADFEGNDNFFMRSFRFFGPNNDLSFFYRYCRTC